MEKCSTPRPVVPLKGGAGLLLTFVLAASVAGCETTPRGATPQGSDPGALTISAAQSSDRELPQGGTYLFDPKSQVTQGTHLSTNRMEEMLRVALAKAMARRGFTPAVGVTPDLVLAYAAGMGAHLDDAGLDELFGISSESLARDSGSRTYDKGTLVVDLYDPFFRKTLWRGAVQGAVTKDLPDDVRQSRITSAVEQLMQRFRKE